MLYRVWIWQGNSPTMTQLLALSSWDVKVYLKEQA